MRRARPLLLGVAVATMGVVLMAAPVVPPKPSANRLQAQARGDELKAKKAEREVVELPEEDPPGIVTSPAAAVKVAHADAKRIRAIDQRAGEQHKEQAAKNPKLGLYDPLLPNVRYFWFPVTPGEYSHFLIVEKVHKNFLSSEPDFVTGVLIAPNVLRYDIRDLGWGDHQRVVLERFAGIDVYFHQPKEIVESQEYIEHWPGGIKHTGGQYFKRDNYNLEAAAGDILDSPAPWLPQEEIDALREWTYSEVPILNAEHFFINTVRQQQLGNKELGVGYYEWFGKAGLKKRDDFFRAVGFDERETIRLFVEWRAIIESRQSGVSQNGRQIVAGRGVTGRVWGTLDVFDESSKSKGLVKDRLRRGELVHDAEEWYAPLPNRLPLTFLAKADGDAQAKAPPEVGGDKSELNIGNDPAIHDNLSCFRCHGSSNMLRPFKDYVRSAFKPGGKFILTDPVHDVQKELRRQYLSNIDRALEKDQEEYKEAFAELTMSQRHPKGLSCARVTKLYCETWNRLVEREPTKPTQPVTLAVAAREVGVDPKKLVELLDKHATFRGQGDLVTLAFRQTPPGALSREEWESRYAFCAGLVLGQAFPERLEQEPKPEVKQKGKNIKPKKDSKP